MSCSACWATGIDCLSRLWGAVSASSTIRFSVDNESGGGRASHHFKACFAAVELADHDWYCHKHIVLRQWIDRFWQTTLNWKAPAIEIDATPAILAPLIVSPICSLC